jgi:uncharacterized protein
LKLQLTNTGSQKMFTAQGPGYVEVNGVRYQQAIVVTPDQVLTDWAAEDFASLAASHFAYLLALQPEILLLGTGERQQFPHPGLYRELIRAGIGIECMDTAAACRTYNILMSEDRKVVAAILL